MQIEMKKEHNGTIEKKERREFFRVELIKRVRYTTSGITSIECFTQNISEGGLCLFLGEALFPGTMIRAEFVLPGKEPKLVKTYAAIVWQQGYLVGAKFIS